jgi:hypothetical protein
MDCSSANGVDINEHEGGMLGCVGSKLIFVWRAVLCNYNYGNFYKFVS